MLTPSEWKYIKRLNAGWMGDIVTNISARVDTAGENTDEPPVFSGTMEDYDEAEQAAQDELALRNMESEGGPVQPQTFEVSEPWLEAVGAKAHSSVDEAARLVIAALMRDNAKALERLSNIPKGNQAEALRRKGIPVATGVLDYFPLALQEIAKVSKKGNDQHNPGQHLHWNRDLSGDESDALIRHFLERGTVDSDGMLHSAKVAWRALALLEKELERDA